MAGDFWANFFNWPIPDPGNAQGQVSPFWDDLSFSGSSYGVYTWHDTTNHRFVIEWYHMTHRNTSALETFELVITDPAYHPTLTGDSELLYLYNDVTNNDAGENYATVGFESWDELMGVQYTHDNVNSSGAVNLVDSRAIRVTTNTGRGGLRGMVDLQSGGLNEGARVSTSSGQHRTTPESGEFWLRNVPPGVVRVMAEAQGYFPVTVDSVEVVANVTLSGIDFTLSACPQPAGLVASDSLGTVIELDWSAVVHGDLDGYNVYRSRFENGEYILVNGEPVQGTHYVDGTPPDSGVYWYYVAAVYSNSGWEAESFGSNKDWGALTNPDDVSEGEDLVPREFFLSQNYPNPFNPATSISYGLPQDSRVRIEVFNILGQNVRTLVDEDQQAGYKRVIWDGRDRNGRAVASGVYFYRLKAGDSQETKKMLMVK
jgi:hypothetical protein